MIHGLRASRLEINMPIKCYEHVCHAIVVFQVQSLGIKRTELMRRYNPFHSNGGAQKIRYHRFVVAGNGNQTKLCSLLAVSCGCDPLRPLFIISPRPTFSSSCLFLLPPSNGSELWRKHVLLFRLSPRPKKERKYSAGIH